jgi:DNA mismatch repair protein MutS2
MRLSRQSAEALEWPTLLKLVAHGAVTDAGRLRLLSLTPSPADSLAAELERGREVEGLLEDGALLPALEAELLPVLATLGERPFDCEAADLVALRELLRATRSAAQRIEESRASCPRLAELTEALPDLSGLSKRLEEVLDARGRIRDDASPLLDELRRRGQRVRQRIYERLERYASEHREDVAESNVTLHEERLVVLVMSGSQKPAGLVHGRSGSGQSVYFEPLDVVADNNELREVRGEEAAERERLVRKLIEASRSQLGELEAHLEFAAELDVRQAAARWGRLAEAAWVHPASNGACRLIEARHPLLDPRLAELRHEALGTAGHAGEVVPLTLELSSSLRLLVVTGPNAGGKTVALKTLGLITLAAHCGLPVPLAPDSQLPLLEGLVAIVGDEQDLMTDKSTFSGRLLRLKEAWDESSPEALVLLDELGSGTDPEEGAALGVALIEGLLDRGALAVVSSHLVRLATAALELDGAGCAAMAFDPETGSPTYRLVPGTPGGSEALALARRLGLARRWLDRAQELLGSEHGELQRLLAEVEAARVELARSAAQAEREVRELEAERRRLEQVGEELDAARKKAAAAGRRKVEEFQRAVRKRLRSELARLEEAFAAGRRRGLVAEAEESLFREAPFVDRERAHGPIVVGARVRHSALGWEGKLSALERGRAEVLVGGKRLRCAAEELEPMAEVESPSTRRRPAVSVSRRDEGSVATEINLRGERVEPALERLERYLDRALLEGLPEVRIVHGHGTGRLKQGVRELVDRHPGVVRWRPGGSGEGGDGATIAALAE